MIDKIGKEIQLFEDIYSYCLTDPDVMDLFKILKREY
jgi:hypothetical protein